MKKIDGFFGKALARGFFLLAFAGISVNARADVYFQFTFAPALSSQTNAQFLSTDPVPTASTAVGGEFAPTAGFLIGRTFLIGATADLTYAKANQDAYTGTNSTDDTAFLFQAGLTAGLVSDGFLFSFSYFPWVSDWTKLKSANSGGTAVSDTETTLTSSQGYQVVLAYLLDLGGGWSIAPTLRYRSIDYDKGVIKDNLTPSNNQTITFAKAANVASLDPMITLSLNF